MSVMSALISLESSASCSRANLRSVAASSKLPMPTTVIEAIVSKLICRVSFAQMIQRLVSL